MRVARRRRRRGIRHRARWPGERGQRRPLWDVCLTIMNGGLCGVSFEGPVLGVHKVEELK